MGEACLEVEDDAPDKVENDRRVAIDNTRGLDVKQFHLEGRARVRVRARASFSVRVPVRARVRARAMLVESTQSHPHDARRQHGLVRARERGRAKVRPWDRARASVRAGVRVRARVCIGVSVDSFSSTRHSLGYHPGRSELSRCSSA